MALPVVAGALEPDAILRRLCETGDAAHYLSLLSVRIDDLAVTAVSPAGESVFAADDDPIIGRSLETRLVEPEGARRSLAMLADGLVDGYHATRQLRLPGGRIVEAPLWVRRVHGGASPAALVIFGLAVVENGIAVVSGRAVEDALPLVVAVIDEQWRVETLSAAIGTLAAPGRLVGRPFSDLVHPDDLGHLLTAFGSALTGNRTSETARVRTDHGWTRCRIDVWRSQAGERRGHTVMLTKQLTWETADDSAGRAITGAASDAVERGSVTARSDLRATTRNVLALLRQSSRPLTAIEVAGRLAISRATAQRHLVALHRAGNVTVELGYGSVGRPSHAYRICAEDETSEPIAAQQRIRA